MKKNGFTLIECMVFCALFALIVTLVTTNLSFIRTMVLRAQVDTLYTTCMYLQQSAYVSGTPCTLTFDVTRNSYTYDGVEHKLADQLLFGTLPNVKGPPSSPVHALLSPVTFTGSGITFYPNGKMQSGTVYITDKNKTALYALTSSVEQLSHLRRYQYDGRWHQLD